MKFQQTALIDRQVSVSSTRTTTAKSVAEEAAGVGAEDDGFSADEIAQFAQLLSCPKKAPPSKYQCHICYQSGHYISDCPMVSFVDTVLKDDYCQTSDAL